MESTVYDKLSSIIDCHRSSTSSVSGNVSLHFSINLRAIKRPHPTVMTLGKNLPAGLIISPLIPLNKLPDTSYTVCNDISNKNYFNLLYQLLLQMTVSIHHLNIVL